MHHAELANYPESDELIPLSPIPLTLSGSPPAI